MKLKEVTTGASSATCQLQYMYSTHEGFININDHRSYPVVVLHSFGALEEVSRLHVHNNWNMPGIPQTVLDTVHQLPPVKHLPSLFHTSLNTCVKRVSGHTSMP